MIRKILIVVVAAGLLSAAGVLSVRHYHTFKAKQDALQHAAQVAAAKQAQAKQAERLGFIADFEKVETSCTEGLKAYQLLPAVVRAKLPAPDCSVSRPIEAFN